MHNAFLASFDCLLEFSEFLTSAAAAICYEARYFYLALARLP